MSSNGDKRLTSWLCNRKIQCSYIMHISLHCCSNTITGKYIWYHINALMDDKLCKLLIFICLYFILTLISFYSRQWALQGPSAKCTNRIARSATGELVREARSPTRRFSPRRLWHPFNLVSNITHACDMRGRHS